MFISVSQKTVCGVAMVGALDCFLVARPVNGRIATGFQPVRCKIFGIKIRKWRSIDINEE